MLTLARAVVGIAAIIGTAGLFGIPVVDHSANAIVDSRHSGADGALVDGIRTYHTIKAALDGAPDNPPNSYRILIKDGRYHEKLNVTKPHMEFIGQSRDGTVLTFDAYSGLKNPDGTNLGTWKCATLIIQAPDFHAENMTIENAWDYPSNDAKYADDTTKTSAPQAVALMTDQGSDRAYFRDLKITGYQDTLFVSSGRSYFAHCLISGHVDFIFGAGQVVFEEDEIVTRARRMNASSPIGYVTAPSTQTGKRFGLVFIRCRLLKESAAVAAGSVPLGRPWHPTTTFPDGRYADPNAVGMSVFLHCFLDDHIAEKGWDRMSGTGKIAGERIWFNPEDSRFFEYQNSGPGARINASRRQLSDAQAREFTVENILEGWRPTVVSGQ